MPRLSRQIPTTVAVHGGAAQTISYPPGMSKSARKRLRLKMRSGMTVPVSGASKTKVVVVENVKKPSPIVIKPINKKLRPVKPIGKIGPSDAKLAEDYALSLIAPELGAIADRPDSSPYRNTKVASSWTLPIAAIADTKGSTVVSAGIVIMPSLIDHYYVLSGYDSSSQSLTWSAAHNHPKYATYAANFMQFQPLSMAATLYQTSANQNLNGIFFANQMVSGPATTGGPLLPQSLTDLTQSPFTAVVGGSETDNIRCSWLPPQSTEAAYMSSYNAPNLDATYLVLFWQGTSATLDAFEVNCHFNFAVEPDEAVADLFPGKPSTGGDDSLLARAMRFAADWTTRVGNTVNALDQWLEQSPVARALTDLGGALASRRGSHRGWGVTRIGSRSGRGRLYALLHDDSLKEAICHEFKIDSDDIERFLKSFRSIPYDGDELARPRLNRSAGLSRILVASEPDIEAPVMVTDAGGFRSASVGLPSRLR